MDLAILILVFAVIGYLFGVSRFGRKVDEAAEKAVNSSKKLADGVDQRWRSRFGRKQDEDPFRRWVSGAGANMFTEEFKSWLNSLSVSEAGDFSRAVDQYGSSLGFSLKSLVDGGLDQDPMLRQVFVEAIAVYSSAYRKAKTAHQQAQKPETAQPETEGTEKTAETNASRRSADSPSEAGAAAQAS